MKEEVGVDTGIGVMHLEACDCKPAAQRVLASLSLDHGAGVIRKIRHVGTNINSRVSQEAQGLMRDLFPRVKPLKLKAEGGPDPEQLDFALQTAREILEQKANFQDGATAWCMNCKNNCKLWGCDEEDAAYSQCGTDLFTAGFTCKDWSTQGTQMGCGGPSMAPFLIMVFELRGRKPRLVILECTPKQPHVLIAALLEDLYFVDSVVISPHHLGWPVRRPRRWPL